MDSKYDIPLIVNLLYILNSHKGDEFVVTISGSEVTVR